MSEPKEITTWLGTARYQCPDCLATGTVDCDCCDRCNCELDCERCEGTGWDGDYIDIHAFREAAQKAKTNYEWIEDGKRLGRRNDGDGRVRATDFLIDKMEQAK